MASFATHLVVVVTMMVAAVAAAEMLQDVCVADLSNGIYLNNTFCLNQFYVPVTCFNIFVYSSSGKKRLKAFLINIFIIFL